MTSTERYESVPCAYCDGRKIDPFHVRPAQSTCPACEGTGRRLVPVPHAPCTFCRGAGRIKTARCPVCRGAGVVVALAEPSGRLADAPAAPSPHLDRSTPGPP